MMLYSLFMSLSYATQSVRCHRVCGAWPLRRQTYGYLPGRSMVVILSARHSTGHSQFHGHAAVLASEDCLWNSSRRPTTLRQMTDQLWTVQATSEITFI